MRLGHRVVRDQRISTHLGLTARALGANNIVFSGEQDAGLLESVVNVTNTFGGDFKASYVRNGSKILRNWNGISVHLTMYGVELADRLAELQSRFKSGQDLLVIVGGAKVSGDIYKLSTYNVCIGNQPHSEVAALAIFLDRLFEGQSRIRFYEEAPLNVIPSERSKTLQKASVSTSSSPDESETELE